MKIAFDPPRHFPIPLVWLIFLVGLGCLAGCSDSGKAPLADTAVLQDRGPSNIPDLGTPDLAAPPDTMIDLTALADTGTLIQAQNPVLTGDHADPHVMRVASSLGRPIYYMTATSGNGEDIPIYSSRDLLSWTLESKGVFGRSSTPGDSLELNGRHYCHIWAPQLVERSPGVFLLSFSAQRHDAPQSPCPPYDRDGGVYLASSTAPTGPYAPVSRPWEPLAAGAQVGYCPDPEIRHQVPHSVDTTSKNCQGTYCHKIIRLDSDVFRDPLTGRWWMAYSWFTNAPPENDWELASHGEHVNIVELDTDDPWSVSCDHQVPQILAGHCQDSITLSALKSSCERCGEMMSFTKGLKDEEIMEDGISSGIVEGAHLFRRKSWVYLLMSSSGWNSAYYNVFWVAAPTVEELRWDNPKRLVGRFLIPSMDPISGERWSFGHGTAVLGPDGVTLFFIYHRLRHDLCLAGSSCARDMWVSPIQFEDRQDGLGQVWIKEHFPAENPSVQVMLP